MATAAVHHVVPCRVAARHREEHIRMVNSPSGRVVGEGSVHDRYRWATFIFHVQPGVQILRLPADIFEVDVEVNVTAGRRYRRTGDVGQVDRKFRIRCLVVKEGSYISDGAVGIEGRGWITGVYAGRIRQ